MPLAPLFPPQPVDADIQGDAVKPGGQSKGRLVVAEGLPNLYADVLHQVLKVSLAAGVQASHLEDDATVLLQYSFEIGSRMFSFVWHDACG